MSKPVWSLFLLFVCSTMAFGHNQTKICILDAAKDGQMMIVRGKVVQGPHDMGFDIPGCKEAMLLTYAGDQDNDVSAAQLRRDGNLKSFQRYTSAVYTPGATKDHAGFVRDESGKIVGKSGWGHPVPFAKYRLVIQSVSNIKARKLPRAGGPGF